MDFNHIQTNYNYLLKTKGGTFSTVADWDSKNRVMTQFSNSRPNFDAILDPGLYYFHRMRIAITEKGFQKLNPQLRIKMATITSPRVSCLHW